MSFQTEVHLDDVEHSQRHEQMEVLNEEPAQRTAYVSVPWVSEKESAGNVRALISYNQFPPEEHNINKHNFPTMWRDYPPV